MAIRPNRSLAGNPKLPYRGGKDPNALVKCYYAGYIVREGEYSWGINSDKTEKVEHWLPKDKVGEIHYLKPGTEAIRKFVRFDWFEMPRWWARKYGFILGSE